MRILLIEDDPDILEMLTFSLRESCFAVDATNSGDEGLSLALINDYDLVILDYMLPGKNGFEICKRLREAGKHVPILMLSVLSEIERKVLVLNSGADDYLTKPFSFEELLARIKVLMRRPQVMMSPVLTVRDISIDSNSQTVRIGRRELTLTRKEFALLEYFARNKGFVLSRGTLMEHVWEKDIDLFSNTIEAHILNLRRKLGTKGKMIVTVPGRGYKLNV